MIRIIPNGRTQETNPDLYNDMKAVLGQGFIDPQRLVLPIPQNEILQRCYGTKSGLLKSEKRNT